MLAALLVAGTAACGGGPASGQTTITVLAAASLTDAFGDLAHAFERARPGTDVELSFAGSTSVREQVLAGAPADLVATADEETMAGLREAGAVEVPVPFATNHLVLAVPAGNPGEVGSLADLARDDLLVGLCEPTVPCGRLASVTLAAADVDAAVDTFEPDVRALATKLAVGELDAGLVYATDVVALGDALTDIGIPLTGENRYPVAVVTASDEREDAEAFVTFVRSDAGRAVLAEWGFEAP